MPSRNTANLIFLFSHNKAKMNIINEIVRGVWLMDQSYAQNFYPIAFKIITGEDIKVNLLTEKQKIDHAIKLGLMSNGFPQAG
jgi:hypothetical protein